MSTSVVDLTQNDSYWGRANYLDKLKDLDIPVFLQKPEHGWPQRDGNRIPLAYPPAGHRSLLVDSK